ncbi:nose resistant to fluoxetine protein 6-like [Lycorma delicatula]|uniref:nose resistant to fluoxetine protein 6-like n=1 Tax=Lycorma delicatula TaxID=130591 RepID=UPI003F50DB0A
MGSGSNFLMWCYILTVTFGLQIFNVFADSIPITAEDSLETRLSEIPKRIKQLSDIAFPDGVPEAILEFYTLPHSQSKICKNHSSIYRNELKEFNPWAVQMIDSSGKIPSGLLEAHFHDLGNFHECLKLGIEDKSPYPVQHCVVQIGNIMRLPKSVVIDWRTLQTVLGGVPVLKPNLHLGICLPASCSLDDIETNYRKVVDKYNLTIYLDKYSCSASNEDTSYSTHEIIITAVVLIPAVICILATIIDLNSAKVEKPGIFTLLVESFSIYQNGKLLLKTSNPKRPLSILNGLRFLSVVWVISSHHWLFSALRPALNFIEMSQLFTKVYAAGVLNGVLAVDVFILINGLLLSYLFMDVMMKGHKFNLLLFYTHRIVRIVPGYTVLILFALTLFPRYFGDGPLWKTYVGRHTEYCYKNWWTNLLFINNYVHSEEQCIPSTWYLSVDMQLHFLAPIFLYSLYKWKSFIKYGIPVCIIISNIISFLNSYLNQFPAGSIIARDFKTVHKFNLEYITTHTKFGPWFVGLALGYILRKIDGKRVKIPSVWVKIGWILSFFVGSTVIMSIVYFHQDDIQYNRILSSSYTGFYSTLWALSIAWLIFACETGYGRPVWRFLSWRLLQPLGKIVFVIYMGHIGIQYAMSSGRKISGYVELLPMTKDVLGELFICISMAPVLSLLFEAPWIRLERLFVIDKKEKKLAEKVKQIETKDDIKATETLVKLNGDRIVTISNGDNMFGATPC